jgi:hypothetical protein
LSYTHTGQVEAHGNAAGPYLKALVYGGVDGIITTFATVTSVAGANLAPVVILIVGIAHLFADGLSMGLGDALSTQAEIDYNNAERLREKWYVSQPPYQRLTHTRPLPSRPHPLSPHQPDPAFPAFPGRWRSPWTRRLPR